MGVVWVSAKDESELRVHRLHLMDYRQRSEGSIDDFVTTARTQALKCEFEESELEEKIIELMIASTPIEAFQRELLGKTKGCKLTDALAEGRPCEAILAGRQEIQKRTSTPLNNVDQVAQACGRAHPPRACPAFKDSCTFSGKIGHWKKFCRKRKGTNRPKEDSKQRSDPKSDGKQHSKGSNRRDRRFHDLEPAASHTSEEDSTEPYDCIRISSVRNEVFTTLDVICPSKKCLKFKLKVGTGAAPPPPPLRTCKQMYKTTPPPQDILEPTRNVELVDYNGQDFPCLGAINLQLRSGGKTLQRQISVRQNWTFHDSLWWSQSQNRSHNRGKIEASISSQFDTLGDFRGMAKLNLKQDWEPFIVTPRKCSIHLKEKLKCELKKTEKQVSSGRPENTQTGVVVSHTLWKKWITPHMHRPSETHSSPEAMSTQSSHIWRAESAVCSMNSLQQVGC